MAGFWSQVFSLVGPPGPAGADGSPLQRQSLQLSTAVLNPGAGLDLTLEAGSLFHLLAVEASSPCWLRVYGSAEARAADGRSAPGGSLPPPGSEFYAELVTTTAAQRLRLAPVPLVQATAGLTHLRLVNTDALERALLLQIDVLTLET